MVRQGGSLYCLFDKHLTDLEGQVARSGRQMKISDFFYAHSLKKNGEFFRQVTRI
jgi:hypothetical protein